MVAAVWIGFDQPRPIMGAATGGRLAAPVWARMMTRYYSGRPRSSPWRPPTGVFEASVDPATGLVLAEGCQPQSGPSYREYFLRGMSPSSVCPSRGLPVEMMADLALPLPDDEEATDLSIELPPELREPLPAPDDDEGDEPAEEPAPEPTAEPTEQPTPAPAATPTPAPPPTPTAEPSPTPEPAAPPNAAPQN